MIKSIKRFFREIYLGIKIANDNYMKGKCNHGKF